MNCKYKDLYLYLLNPSKIPYIIIGWDRRKEKKTKTILDIKNQIKINGDKREIYLVIHITHKEQKTM